MFGLPPTNYEYLIMNNHYVSLLTWLLYKLHMPYFVCSLSS